MGGGLRRREACETAAARLRPCAALLRGLRRAGEIERHRGVGAAYERTHARTRAAAESNSAGAALVLGTDATCPTENSRLLALRSRREGRIWRPGADVLAWQCVTFKCQHNSTGVSRAIVIPIRCRAWRRRARGAPLESFGSGRVGRSLVRSKARGWGRSRVRSKGQGWGNPL